MKGLLLSMVLAAMASTRALAGELQMFDPAVFGKRTSEPVKLLLDKARADDLEPYVIWTDIRCGRYVAATAFYGKPVTMADGREALDRLYGRYALDKSVNSDRTLWRVESERFGIQLVDKADDGISIIYLHFAPSKDVWKSMMKAQGFAKAAEVMKDADCSEWEELLAPTEGE